MDWLKRTASLGLGVALAFVVLASGWLAGGVAGDLAAEQRQREAVLLANAISASLAGADEAAKGQRLAKWKAEHAALESARVVVGREMQASTLAADEAPRALRREEKALFDLANELRAAAETNVAEGTTRKRTLRVEGSGREGAMTVSVPVLVEGKVEGMVQARVRASGESTSPGGGWAMALALVAAGLAVGAFLHIKAERLLDVPRGIAVLLLVLGTVIFQQQRLEQMAGTTAASDIAIGKVQAAAGATYARSGAPALAPPAGEAGSPWDTDGYGRPRGLVDAEGRPLAKANLAAASHTSFLKKSFWVIGALGVATLLFFVLGWAARTARALKEHRVAYAYVAPAMIGMLVLVFFPFFYGIALAFTDTTLFNENLPFRERFIGLGNFFNILGDFDIVKTTAEGTVVNYQNFYWTLMVTVIWTVTNVTVGVTFGFLLALALNTEGFKGKTIYRVLLILPWAIPNYITALVWRGMFHPQFGVINQALQMFGLAPVRWFDGVVSSFMTGLVTNGWLSFPFMMVVILGALQSIPKDMYEAADVEGATRWQQFRRITLPLLRPTLVPAIVISVVWTFNMFNIIFLVSGGEPGGANEILVTKAYKIAFEQYQYAYAAAYSTVIFVILLVYGYFQTRLTRATESY